jgi:DNA polymerase I-like protein with 3'-5' exonuclease and polymerase domains
LKREERPVLRKTVATIAKGNQIKKKFLERTPALKRLKEVDIPKATEQGYLVGLDGRKLWLPNEHLALSLYLQGFEAVVMKTSMILWHREAQRLKIPYKQTAMVHDEVCVETYPEYGETLGKLIADSYRQAGAVLGSKCPLDGAYSIGDTWAKIH